MKVIVVEKIENYACEETFVAKVGTTTITMSDMLYRTFTGILGVYVSADVARKAIENEKMELMKAYGEKVFDDENLEDNHTYFTFASRVLDVKGEGEAE